MAFFTAFINELPKVNFDVFNPRLVGKAIKELISDGSGRKVSLLKSHISYSGDINNGNSNVMSNKGSILLTERHRGNRGGKHGGSSGSGSGALKGLYGDNYRTKQAKGSAALEGLYGNNSLSTNQRELAVNDESLNFRLRRRIFWYC
jgi:hypothetical protein